MKKVVVFSLGCKVNSCESASIIKGFEEKGYEVSDKLEFADVYVINTCAVTNEAEKKSRQAVSRVRKFNKNAKIIITGCASQKSPESFLGKDGVSLVTGTCNKSKIPEMLDESGIKICNQSLEFDECLPPKTTKTRAYVKIQDGCNNFCSYCIIPYLRGRNRSRNPINIRREIEYLSPKEIVLTGINLTAYNYLGCDISSLIEMLSDLDLRIRLGSLEENIINEKFLESLKGLKDFAPHFHLSLQSGCDKVLKDMNRKYDTLTFLNSVKLIRKYFKNAGITTDIIVGYPTETEEDFNKTIEFAKEVGFSDIHCFVYSKRDGTKSSKLKDLSDIVKKQRLEKILELKNHLKEKFILENINKTFNVIIEEYVNGYSVGYTENYVKVYINKKLENKKYKITLIKPFKDGAIAEFKE